MRVLKIERRMELFVSQNLFNSFQTFGIKLESDV